MRVKTAEHRELIDITGRVEELLPEGFSGAVMLYTPHTTAAVTVNEGFDPDVVTDVSKMFDRLVPSDMPQLHAEGNSDAHTLSTLIGVSVLLPVCDGALSLGRWQRIFFCEFDGPRSREVSLTYLSGEHRNG